MQFPPPYLTIPSVIVVRKNVNRNLTLEMLKGMHVVMVSGYGYVDLIRNKFPNVEIELVPDLTAALRKVSFGMADAFVGDLATASFNIEAEGITNLRLAGNAEPPNIAGFAVRSDWPELSAILDKGMSMVTKEERQAIFNKWIHLEAEPGVTMRELRNLIFLIISVIGVICIIFLLWNRSLQRMVNRRTESLQEEFEERKRAEEALQQSEEQFRHFFEHLTIGVAIYEAVDDGDDFVFFAINPEGEKLSQVSFDEIRGKRLSLIFPGAKDLGLFKALQNVWRTGNPEYVPFRLYKDERIQQSVENRVFKLPSGRVVAVYDDRTEVIRLEEGLRQAQKMESVGRLAGGIAHDFNNMLSAILGNAEMALLKYEKERPVSDNLEAVIRAAKRARDLVSQILTFSRKQEQKTILLNPSLIVTEALKLLRASIPSSIEIRSNIRSHGRMLADPTQLHQVVMNLCTNGYHAMKDSRGTLSITLEDLDILPGKKRQSIINIPFGRYIHMEVSDTGCGMDQATLEKIFEPYFTTKEKGSGTGLGLAVVHGIVKAHGGHIRVSSKPDEGTTFRLFFPCVDEEDLQSEEPIDNEIHGGTERILLVDDEEDIIEIVTAMLEHYGYLVTPFLDSEQALRYFLDNPKTVDLVITDLTMPRLSGYELARQLLEVRSDLPIILCTGFNENVQSEELIASGIKRYLQKPVEMHDMLETIREILD